MAIKKKNKKIKQLLQPSLSSVDGSCVGERVSWTYLTLTSMDVIDSLNATLVSNAYNESAPFSCR